MGSSETRAARTVLAVLVLALTAPLACKGKKTTAPTAGDDAGAAGGAFAVEADPEAAVDALGDPLPAGAQARLGSLRMLDRNLEALQFLPGGDRLVSASYDRYVVWEVATGRRLFELTRSEPGPALAATPNGKRLATSVAGRSEIQIWDLEARAPLPVLTSEREAIALCYLDDQRLVAASEALVLVLGAGQAPVRIQGNFGKLTSVACGAGQVIGLGNDAGGVFVIDLRKGLLAAVGLGAADKRVGQVAVSPDGTRIAAASDDGNVLLWPVGGGEPVRIQAHDRTAATAVFSSDGRRLWTSGGDAWLRSWDPGKGTLIEEITAQSGLAAQQLALSPDGRRAATWGQHRGAKGSEAGRFWLWDLATGDPLAEPERHEGALSGITYSPDGALIATASEDHTVRLWDAKTGAAKAVLTSPQGAVNALEFAGGGELIYSAGADARLIRWRHRQDAVDDALGPIGGKVNAFDVAEGGKHAVTGDETGRVWMWDLSARARMQALDRRTYASVTAVALSPDGKLLAIGGSERVVLVLRTESGSEVARLSPDVVSHLAVRFSPDGALLATASDDGRARLWDTGTWKQIRALEGHDSAVRCLAFSPDGKRLATGSSDATARLWEVASGAELAALSGHGGAVAGVAFSPDGKALATASRDHTALVWPVPAP
jgi:WD40 repeat protein